MCCLAILFPEVSNGSSMYVRAIMPILDTYIPIHALLYEQRPHASEGIYSLSSRRSVTAGPERIDNA
jgi:hypothetical protein